MVWRRRTLFGLGAAWAIVSVARLDRLVGSPATPPGEELTPMLDFLRSTIPPSAGYLYVLPGVFGTDTGTAPRLRYELFPRRYDDVRAPVDETQARQLLAIGKLQFVVVPDASRYEASSWLRQTPDWLRRIELDANRYVLEVVSRAA